MKYYDQEDLYVGTVEKIVFGGYGLIRQAGFIVFVPFTIPGEIIQYTIIKKTSSYAHGKLIQVIRPSLERIAPKCPHFSKCGGCHFQHMTYTTQCHYKKMILLDTFRKMWPSPIDLVPSPDIYAYRRKITLHAKKIDSTWNIGYYAPNSRTHIAIECCPLFSTSINLHLIVTPLLSFLPSDTAEVTIFQLENGLGARLSITNAISKKTLHKIVDFERKRNTLSFLEIKTPSYSLSIGSNEQTFFANDRLWFFSTNAFIQTHRSLSAQLWNEIASTIRSIIQTGKILDLYAGVGISSILLAEQGFSVDSVELSKEACLCAKKNGTWCKKISYTPPNIHNTSVESFLTTYTKPPKAVILNPPRTGLTPIALSEIIRLKSPTILYISCSPPSAARDISSLIQHGYTLITIKAFDLFPQTTHFESLFLLHLS